MSMTRWHDDLSMTQWHGRMTIWHDIMTDWDVGEEERGGGGWKQKGKKLGGNQSTKGAVGEINLTLV